MATHAAAPSHTHWLQLQHRGNDREQHKHAVHCPCEEKCHCRLLDCCLLCKAPTVAPEPPLESSWSCSHSNTTQLSPVSARAAVHRCHVSEQQLHHRQGTPHACADAVHKQLQLQPARTPLTPQSCCTNRPRLLHCCCNCTAGQRVQSGARACACVAAAATAATDAAHTAAAGSVPLRRGRARLSLRRGQQPASTARRQQWANTPVSTTSTIC